MHETLYTVLSSFAFGVGLALGLAVVGGLVLLLADRYLPSHGDGDRQ
jgi:hypothetical protein